jgi:hypothetical protein
MTDELIERTLDEEFVTLTEVERDPVAAWMTIVDNAVRIEELVEERDITRRLLAAATQMQTETQAKLAKAMEAIKHMVNIAPEGDDDEWHIALDDATDLLAELEGEPLGAEFEAVWDANKDKLYEE